MQVLQTRPGQYVAYPGAVAPAQTSMTSMLEAIMPIIVLMMMMGMMMPMMRGITAD